ncbi:MAG: helix-turn-helix domain-containing protein [Actinomycetota bacterium]|nr:helix-turn-helix domain-containing protein [Actinomycetota bacterium]
MRAEKEAASDAPEGERGVVNITDPQAIRALAHKVRLDVIDELFGSEETYTATELARSFGLTPSAMSYHLRALEKWGYVVRAKSSGDGRERHWKSAGDTLNVGDKSDVSELVSSTLIDVTLNATRERVLKALVQADSRGEDDPRTLMLASSKIRLTKEEAKDFAEEYHRLVGKYRKLRADPAHAGRREQMHLTTIFVPEVSDQT